VGKSHKFPSARSRDARLSSKRRAAFPCRPRLLRCNTMSTLRTPTEESLSSPDLETNPLATSEASTICSDSGQNSPTMESKSLEDVASGPPKKKKKKKSKKPKAKDAGKGKTDDNPEAEGRPSVLCISRNKHWRYISSYHVRGCAHLPWHIKLRLFVGTLAAAACGTSRFPSLHQPRPRCAHKFVRSTHVTYVDPGEQLAAAQASRSPT